MSPNNQVPTVMCKMLGFTFGRKLENISFVYGQDAGEGADEQGLPTKTFVLDKIRCQGDETSVFDCDLGLWYV